MREEAIAAELAVIGSILCEPAALREIVGFLGEEHFYNDKYRLVYRRVLDLMRDGKPYDVISTGTAMSKDEMEMLGGMKFLFEVTNKIPSALHAKHYAEVMVKAYSLRALTAAAKELIADPADEAIQMAMRNALASLQILKGGSIVRMGEGLSQYTEMMDKRIAGRDVGFTAHFPTMNRMTNGVCRGTLWTFGARTSRGKSSIMLRMSNQIAVAGSKVLFISAEMTAVELLDRIISMRTGIPLLFLRTKEVNKYKERVVEEMSRMYTLPITMSVGGKLTMERVLTEVDTHQPDVVVVDYLQRFVTPSHLGGGGTRASYYSDVANGLKALALDRNIAVITGSQLSRGVELREDQTPTLADLKESGGIEEASDVVALLDIPSEGTNGFRRGEYIVAKHRNGPLGRFPIRFKEATTDFQEIVDEADEVFP